MKRGNSEGSIYHRGYSKKTGKDLGYAAYVWVDTPNGGRKRKYLYGHDRKELHQRWVKLQVEAQRETISTSSPKLKDYLAYWLEEIIRPNREPKTYSGYESFVRLHIRPWIGEKTLHSLRAKHLQQWLNKLAVTCQCCMQGKDAARLKPRCCAKHRCCNERLSKRTISDVRGCLRSALAQAIVDEHINTNCAMQITLPSGRNRRRQAWSSDEARRFLEHVRDKPLYAAYLLILVMGLRKGEVLGLTWSDLDLEDGELSPRWQLQRVGGELLHKRLKTAESENVLPLPEICIAALKARREQQRAQEASSEIWNTSDLVFTSRHGAAIEPRNFNRYFDAYIEKLDVPRITVHDARRTCASLLVDLDVHPRIIMAILRHADLKVTMEIYAQASATKTREALKRLSDSLG